MQIEILMITSHYHPGTDLGMSTVVHSPRTKLLTGYSTSQWWELFKMDEDSIKCAMIRNQPSSSPVNYFNYRIKDVLARNHV